LSLLLMRRFLQCMLRNRKYTREKPSLQDGSKCAVVYAESFMYANAINPTTTSAAGGHERGWSRLNENGARGALQLID
jgi:hypothetical protein